MKIQENIASTIRAVMRERELTITEAAEEFCISRTALQDYLKADSNPRSDTIEMLSQKLGVSLAELVSGASEAKLPCRSRIHPLFEPLMHDMFRLSGMLYAFGVPEDGFSEHK